MYCKPRRRCMPKPNFCMKPKTTKVLPAKIHPTKQNVVEKTCEYIVPEVYPTHTTHVTNHVYKHVNSYPHTQSFEETVQNQQFSEAPFGQSPSFPVAGAMSGGQMCDCGCGKPKHHHKHHHHKPYGPYKGHSYGKKDNKKHHYGGPFF